MTTRSDHSSLCGRVALVTGASVVLAVDGGHRVSRR